MTSAHPPLTVVLACSGLDHAHRGFESFARECFEQLRDEPSLDLVLLKGSGPEARREFSVPSITRDAAVTQALGRLTHREAFRFEQLAFAFGLQPELLRRKPDVVYFSEWHTGLALAVLRKTTRQSYRLVLCNGTMAAQGFGHLDRVQELTPAALETVLDQGGDPRRHVLLPLAFDIPAGFSPVGPEERAALRRRLGLPADRTVLVSAAALNAHHKRLDYLIREVARLPAPRPFVLLLGQVEAETARIRALAQELLGPDGHSIRTLPRQDVRAALRAGDAFVLTSLGESFGRVLVEAMAEGLPCLVHDYPVTRYVLGDQGRYADLSSPEGLAGLLRRPTPRTPAGDAARHEHVASRLSWEVLRPRYLDLLHGAA